VAVAADVADGEVAADEGVDVDAAGEEVASGADEAQPGSCSVRASTTSPAISVSW
jgi:hypothetical protein